MIKHLDNLNDFEKVIANQKVLIDFFATWCGPCKMLTPMLEKIDEKNPDWTIVKIDIDKFRELTMQYNVQAVPTLIFLKDGKPVETKVGFLPDIEIQKIINKI